MRKDKYTYRGWASGSVGTLYARKERQQESERLGERNRRNEARVPRESIYRGGIRAIGGKITAHAVTRSPCTSGA